MEFFEFGGFGGAGFSHGVDFGGDDCGRADGEEGGEDQQGKNGLAGAIDGFEKEAGARDKGAGGDDEDEFVGIAEDLSGDGARRMTVGG